MLIHTVLLRLTLDLVDGFGNGCLGGSIGIDCFGIDIIVLV